MSKKKEPIKSSDTLPEDGRGRKKKLEVPVIWFILLHLSLVVNSLAGAASKMAKTGFSLH